jgi:hypothetical protein
MKLGLISLLLVCACSAASAVEPNAAEVTITVGQAGACYAMAHSMDAGKAERQKAFDACACEAGHCQ